MSKNKIDPICGMDASKSSMKIIWKGDSYYFCSSHCMNKFIKQNGIENSFVLSTNKYKNWWKNKLLWVVATYLLIIVTSFIFPFLRPLRIALFNYIGEIIWAILLGLLVGGVIDWLVPREYISKLLSKSRKSSILWAIASGFFMAACSHGILAIAIQLYKKGASTSSVVAFLLASPWANLPFTILMFGFFGIKALLIVVSAIIVAMITGYIFLFFEKRSLIEINPNSVEVNPNFSILNDIKVRFSKSEFTSQNIKSSFREIFKGAISLGNMVVWWILIGIFLASAVAAYLPTGIMHQYMGPSFVGLIITLSLATIMEICSEGTAPLAFEIYRTTGALGNSFAFLMAGVVTDYTEIGLLWNNIGKRTALLLPIVTVPQVIILGYLFNRIFI